MRLSAVRAMEFLLTRYVRSGREVAHVVDPYLDLRHRFADLVRLNADVNARRLDIDVLSLASDYLQWWNRFLAVQRFEDDRDTDADTRRRLRVSMLDNANGIIGAMRLPNIVESDSASFEEAAKAAAASSAVCQRLTLAGNSRFEALRVVRRVLDDLLAEHFQPRAVRLSPPRFVRPALVEACNLDIQRFLTVPDGTHFFCLAGISLPSLVACFVRQALSYTNHWPLTFFADGEEYNYELSEGRDKELFTQTPVLFALSLYRDGDEATVGQCAVLTLLGSLASRLTAGRTGFHAVPPSELELYESAAVVGRVEGVRQPWVRFARLGDYVSRRIHLVHDPKATPHGFVGMHLTRIDLSIVVDCCMKRE